MNRLGIALGALAFMRIAAAADSPEYGPIPSWVRPAEAPTSVAAPDNSPVKQLLQDQQFNFLPLSQETFFEGMVRIQTAQGLQSMSTIQLPWKPDTDVLTIHKVQIQRGDQVIDALAGGQKFTLLRRENNLEYSALDGVLTAAFQPADLRVGDIVDIAFSIKRTDPILAGAAEQIAGGWIQGPIARVHLRARWPRSSLVRWRSTDEIRGLKEQRDGDFTEVTYTSDNLEPPVQATAAPLRFAITRAVEFSGFKSWPDVSRRLAPLFIRASTLASDSPLKAEITRIKASAHTPTELATAALVLVEDNVRYVYLGMNQGGIVPAPADLTWSRRFGDCKAKTVLLIALLRELGIDAEPVAVSTTIGDGLDARLPMIGLFDHVIVRAHVGGQVYWLDGTRSADRHLQALRTPNYHWGLPLLAAGSELTRIEAVPLTEPERDTHIQIDATAGIRVPAAFHVETILHGDAAVTTNLQLASLTGDSLDRGLREYWTKTYDFVDIHSVNVRFDGEAVTETLSMDGSARMVWKDQWYETDGLGVGFEARFTRPSGSNAQAPYAVEFPLYVRTSEKILLPKVGAPFTTYGNAVDRVIGGIEYKRKFSLAGETFTAEASTRSIQQEFSADEATEAQTALRTMARDALYLRSPNRYFLTDAEVADELTHKLSTANEYVSRGNMLLDHKDYDRAIADFDKAIAMDPKADMALADRGIAYLWKNDPDRAVKDWNAAEAVNPKNAIAPRGRGVLAFRAANYADAIADFTKSLETQPNDEFALAWRAFAEERLNRNAEVIADSTAVLNLAPTRVDMYQLRGVAQVRTGRIDAAVADARAVIAANSNPVGYKAAGNIYAVAGKKDDALQAINHVIEVAPDEETLLLRAGLRPSSDQSGRRADIDAALRLNPRSSRALYMKAGDEYASAQYADAVTTVTGAIAIDGSKFEFLLLRALARARAGQSTLSEEDIKQARASANTANKLNNFCWDLATADIALSEALSACDEAVSKSPGWAAYLDSRGFVLLRLGRNTESIAAYDSALALNQNLSSSLYGRGLAKHAAGDRDGGDRDIAAALAANKGIADSFATFGLKP